MTASDLLALLEAHGHRTRGKRAQCPACDSRRLDLIVDTGGEGQTLAHCHHRNCTHVRICEALEIDPRSLSPFSVNVVQGSSLFYLGSCCTSGCRRTATLSEVRR